MDASSAAAWSWPEAVRPAINKHIDHRHAAYNSSITPRAAAATAVQQIVVVHTKIRKATGPPPLDAYFFKRMCRRTSANNNNNDSNVVTGGGNYYPTFQRWPAYHNATAATATAASAMETLPGDRATATAASAIETLYVDRAATNATATMQTLPIEILRQIGAFAGGCFSLGETCKANLGVTNELHYAINIMDNAFSFSAAEDPTGALSNRHMMGMKPPGAYFNISSIAQDPSGGSLSSRHRMGGVNPTLAALPNEHMGGGGGGGGVKRPGALTTGRIVTRITVTGCTDLKDTHGGYQVLEEAVKRVVKHSIPTLRSITVRGRRGRDSPRVAAILGDLVSLAANRNRVAPNLVRVELNHGATAFSAAGKAIEAGLWPALEELVVPNCHAKLGHARKLVSALSSGRAANLRVLVWDEQASTQHEHLDNAILSALSAGRCPRIERLSFANSKLRINPSYTLLNTILACPALRELRLTRKSMSTQRVFYVTCRASRLENFRQKLAAARTKRLGV